MSQNNPARKPTERVAIFSSALFLFGLAGLIMLHLVWPWILLLIFLMAVPVAIAEEGWRMGLWIMAQTMLWLGGIAFLIWVHLVWPGVLVLMGMSALIVAIAPPDKVQEASRPKGHKAKRDFEKAKRGLPLPLDRLEEEESYREEDEESRAAFRTPVGGGIYNEPS